MKGIFVLLLFIFSTGIWAQLGIKGVTTLPKTRIAEISSNNKLFPFLAGAGIDYWFRLKKYRLEIFPTLQYQYAHENVTLDDNTKGELNWKIIDFSPVLQFYPLDFFNDCKCPTFSKQGLFLKKGLFLQLAPGVAFSNLSGKQTEPANIKEWILFVRAGAGLDFGISDLITISPAISYQLGQNLDWSEFFSSNSSSRVNVMSGLYASLRIGWRFDRRNY